MAPGGRKYDTNGHVEIWAAQALPLGAAFPPLHPCWEAGQLAMFSGESEVWIFMYNLLILMLSNIYIYIYIFFFFFPPKKTVGMKSPQ